MPKVKKIPMRMCIACHEMKAKKEMLRVVKNKEGEVFIDFTGKAAGRGAYLCDRPDCVKKLKKARLLNKTFSCEIPDSVYERIEEEFFAKKKSGNLHRLLHQERQTHLRIQRGRPAKKGSFFTDIMRERERKRARRSAETQTPIQL